MLGNMDHLTRQFDLIPVEALMCPITVIGAGAIGGWVTLSLAKMGFENIQVYDDDKVEVENLNSQFYRFSDIGKPKVAALADLVDAFTGVKINFINERFNGGKIFNGILISAVDSMSARRSIWESQKLQAPNLRAVIDPRMGAEQALLYVMNPMLDKDVRSYEKTLCR
jgi:molybdopterin/thiamine biosynthesis adenylyltransferase